MDNTFENYTPELGDIVIIHGGNGQPDSVGMVVGLTGDKNSVYLGGFGINGMGASGTPSQRGTKPGQWKPKKINPQLLP